MKTLMTAAILSALTMSTIAFGHEPGKSDTNPTTKTGAPKATGKTVTVEELGDMLHGLGYEPKPVMNKEGKTSGYEIVIRSASWSIYALVDISPSGKNIWISWTLKTGIDESAPPAAVLAVLEQNHKIFPAYITYFPKTKSLWLAYRLLNRDVTSAVLRVAIDDYAEAVKATLTAWDKAVAAPKEKREGQPEQPQ
ncbi:MAG: hypothetical protein C0467_31225 [Planctomycetaceae bacterium]|nr:hypothetical protein [Planctomycetaceae bacterium]